MNHSSGTLRLYLLSLVIAIWILLWFRFIFSIAFKSTDRARCSYFHNHAQSNDAMTMYNLLFCSMSLVVTIVGSFVFFGIFGKEATAILGFIIYILRLYVRPTLNSCLCSVLDILGGCQLK